MSDFGPVFAVKAEVASRMAYVMQVAHHTDDEELLKWLINRLAEPYAMIQKRRAALGFIDADNKKRGNDAK